MSRSIGAVVAVAIAAAGASSASAQSRDAGSTDAAVATIDAGPDPTELAVAAANAEAQRDEELAAKFDGLPDTATTLPEALAERFAGVRLEDPAQALALALARERAATAAAREAETLAAIADAGATISAAARRARARGLVAAAEASWLRRTQETRTAQLTDDKERELALRKEQSKREERDAKEAQRLARKEQRDAKSPAELALSEAREKLESVRASQARFEQRLLRRRTNLATLEADHAEFLARINASATFGNPLDATPPIEHVEDPLFQTLSAELAASRVAALGSIIASLRDPPRPREPSLLDAEVLALRERFPKQVEALLEQRSSLELRATTLAIEARDTVALELEHHVAETKELTEAVVTLLAASDELRGELRSLRREAGVEVRGEAVQIFVLFADWARRRFSQVSRVGSILTDWSALASIAWVLLKLALLLLLLRWALGRWTDWMQAAVEAVGATLTYGQAALLMVRLAESAKQFGPPLLTLAFGILSYHLFADLAGELEMLLALLIAVAAIRVQLRMVESACERLAARSLEKERERRSLELEQEADEGEATAPEAPEPEPEPEEPAPLAQSGWKLFAITWRRLTRYVSVFTVLLVITDHTIGRGVFWGLVIRWGWLGAIPLTLFFLRTWRQRIVDELNKRAPGQKGAGPLSRLAKNHSHRVYGVFIVFAAFLVVLGRRSAAFVRDHLSNLDSTKRLLAFLFRRRVQKHAREHGRVLEKPHELPETILDQFPEGPIAPERRPYRPALLAEIREAYERWQCDGTDGTIAVVGDAGMGKSTVLGLMPATLETEIEHVSLAEKITEPEDLVRWLAGAFGCEGNVHTERQLISALRAEGKRILAIDDCHNLFLREVGGFEAWNCFTRLINETNDQIFWVLTLSKAAWEYLQNVGGGVAYFRKVINMPAWTEIELRRLILTRMRRARYRVNFSDLLVTRLEGVKVSSQIIRTSQGYFRLLWDYSDGNPGLACFFWLRSLVPDIEGKSVRVHLFAAPKIEELQALPDDIAFVLTAVVEHEIASPVELATITNLPEQLCRFAVNYGRERGYLVNVGDRVTISPLWQQTVLIYLKRKHLLYS